MAYHPKTLQCLGITQIVTGTIAFFLGIGSAVVGSDFTSFAGFGIWVGVWILITGVLGYCGARDKNASNSCLLGTFMGFAITGCVLCGIMFICYCVALSILSSVLQCHRWNSSNYYNIHHYTYAYHQKHCAVSYSKASAGIGLGSVLLIISLLEFFVALTSSIYCCNAVCCGQPTVATTQQTVVFQHQQVPGVAVVSGTGGATVIPPLAGGPVILQQPAQPAFMAVSQSSYVPGYSPAYPPVGTTMVTQPPPYTPAATHVQVTHN